MLHSVEVSRDIEAKEMSSEVGWLLDGSLVGVFFIENSVIRKLDFPC